MNIKVLGAGCSKCKTVETVTREAVAELGLKAEISKVEDIVSIMGYGVMRTPAIVVNEKVMISGRVPSLQEVKDILTKIE
jgi:small redox-active disulfide protein 2